MASSSAHRSRWALLVEWHGPAIAASEDPWLSGVPPPPLVVLVPRVWRRRAQASVRSWPGFDASTLPRNCHIRSSSNGTPTSLMTNEGGVSIASWAWAGPSLPPRTLPLTTDMTSTRRWPGAAQCGSPVSSVRAASPTGPSSTRASARDRVSTRNGAPCRSLTLQRCAGRRVCRALRRCR